MKIELLNTLGGWVNADYKSIGQLLDQYSDAILVTTTNKYDYYAVASRSILFRIEKPRLITKAKAEKEFGIKIIG